MWRQRPSQTFQPREFLLANIGQITNIEDSFIYQRSIQMFTRKWIFSVSYYSPKCFFFLVIFRRRSDACCCWGRAWRHAREAHPSGKPRAKMAACCFLPLENIYISLYPNSIVCNVRIQVVDGRSGDFRNFKSVEPLASQNDWRRSILALCGHLLVKTGKCSEETSAFSSFILYLFTTNVNKDPATGFSL